MRTPLALALIASLSAACVLPGDFDWMFVVRNDTNRILYLRAPLSTERDETLQRVARVPPGSHGRSVEWFGAPDNEISVLDADCRLLGTFDRAVEPSVDVTVPAVPGLTGRVEPYHVVNARGNEPIEVTDDCDGFIYV